ncbi:GNAT family N-acetyltransferase [Pacificoceanicola onchidii]|uniref:GNAT family N-acetyltransferase n=1 Tax=Pacificoceanicola onchidii TaxID=2562685 RepID=UPI0010A5C23A|nr:GNAT family N-acetyltransferase [Pacificoceanicola onchidii]
MIRAAKPSDMAQLVKLIEAHAAYEGFPFQHGFPNRAGLERLAFGHSTRLLIWVAEQDDQLIGYMSATVDYSTWNAAAFLYLDCLYLTEAARGLGLGKQMMETLDLFAAERGIPAIEWQTPPDNALGLGFYRHIGARELPKRRFTRSVPSLFEERAVA